MTSQIEKTDERVALETKAKAMGIKGRLPNDDDALVAKIEAVGEIVEEVVEKTEEVEVPARSKAPSMNVASIGKDDRTAKIAELERLDPGCKYLYQNPTITDAELKAKGFERTSHTVKNDIICRTTMDSYKGYQSAKNDTNYDAMQRIDGGTGMVGNHDAQVKTPK